MNALMCAVRNLIRLPSPYTLAIKPTQTLHGLGVSVFGNTTIYSVIKQKSPTFLFTV